MVAGSYLNGIRIFGSFPTDDKQQLRHSGA